MIEWLDEPPDATLDVYEEQCRSIITGNDSPDIPFSYTLNPYRGCFHGCIYCYARTTHQYLGYGAGTDFERKLVVKKNAPEKLVEEFDRPRWEGSTIAFSGVTDCYQPLEAEYELTRRCLKVCADYRNPVSIITKGALIRRDLDVLQDLALNAAARVYFSIAFADDEIAKKLEPFAPRPSVRFRAMEALAKAKIPVGLALAPVIISLNDDQIPKLIERAADCGADSAFISVLRLPAEVKDVFIARLTEEFPNRAQKVLSQLRQVKDGELNRSKFGERFLGEGPLWEMVQWMFSTACEKHKLNVNECAQNERRTFRRPSAQLELPLG